MLTTHEQLGAEYRNVSLCHSTLKIEDLYNAVSHLLPFDIQTEWDVSANDEERGWTWETVVDYLNEIAPDGCYFGTHEGDAADFGFWTYMNVDDD